MAAEDRNEPNGWTNGPQWQWVSRMFHNVDGVLYNADTVHAMALGAGVLLRIGAVVRGETLPDSYLWLPGTKLSDRKDDNTYDVVS